MRRLLLEFRGRTSRRELAGPNELDEPGEPDENASNAPEPELDSETSDGGTGTRVVGW